jgi:hypothetical protein
MGAWEYAWVRGSRAARAINVSTARTVVAERGTRCAIGRRRADARGSDAHSDTVEVAA